MGAHDAPVRRTAARRPECPGGARCIRGKRSSTGYKVNALINVGVPLSPLAIAALLIVANRDEHRPPAEANTLARKPDDRAPQRWHARQWLHGQEPATMVKSAEPVR